jgi:hypothetical protein
MHQFQDFGGGFRRGPYFSVSSRNCRLLKRSESHLVKIAMMGIDEETTPEVLLAGTKHNRLLMAVSRAAVGGSPGIYPIKTT